MSVFTMQTALTYYVVTTALCTAVMVLVWLENRKRFPGIVWWLLAFIGRTLGALLIVRRGIAPDWASIVLANAILTSSIFWLLTGLERFAGVRNHSIPNLTLVLVFTVVHAVFTWVQPDLSARNLNVSITAFILHAQIVWLILRRVSPDMQRIMRGVLLVGGLNCLSHAIRIAVVFLDPPPGNDLFSSGLYDALVIVSLQLTMILTTFALILVINQRLQHQVQEQEVERVHLTERIQNQARQLEQVLATVPTGVILIQEDGHILLTNPVADRMLATLAGPQATAPLQQLGDRPLAGLLLRTQDGRRHEITSGTQTFTVVADRLETATEPASYVLALTDITREREIQSELHQQERLAAVGQLAAGIAHHFNNTLAVIALYAQMDLRTPGVPASVRSHIGVIERETGRAAELIQQIVDFGRRAIVEPAPLDLVPFLKEHVYLLQRTLPEHIRITLEHPPAATVNADPTRIQQLLTNLALNARDAMPQGGELGISVAAITVAPDQPAPHVDMRPGPWVKIAVADTGTGIAPAYQRHIFEPFFTTKAPDQGTGLGLAQVYGIVKQHNGHIDFDTQVGRGTTFTIYLPALDTPPAQTASTDDAALPHGRREIILVVEDNPSLRQAIVETLQLLDYTTLEAGDGQEALDLLTSQPNSVAIILSDLIMPEMGGAGLFSALMDRGIDLPMIIMSGHPMEGELADLKARGLAGWISKPPDIADIAALLNEHLAR